MIKNKYLILAALFLGLGQFASAEVAGLKTDNAAAVQNPTMSVPEAAVASEPGDYMDLHMHTYCSDGWSIPEHIIKLAAGESKFFLSGKPGPAMKYIAITDHDTTGCVSRAQQFAAKKYPGMKVIGGIELTANDNTHILGLNINLAAPAIQKLSDNNRKGRVERTYGYIKKLKEMGADITLRDVIAPKLISEYRGDGKSTETIAGMTDEQILSDINGMLMRPDIAKALIAKGYAKDNREAFDKWITPANVPGESLNLKEAIDAIHSAGGIAILAHPYTIYRYCVGTPTQTYGDQTFTDADPMVMFHSVVQAMLEAGLDGMEAYKKGWKKYPEDYKMLVEIASKWKKQSGKELIFTGGSDYHGVRGIGPWTMMDEKLPMEAQQALTKALNLN